MASNVPTFMVGINEFLIVDDSLKRPPDPGKFYYSEEPYSEQFACRRVYEPENENLTIAIERKLVHSTMHGAVQFCKARLGVDPNA